MLNTIWKFISLKIISPISWGKIHAFFSHGKAYNLTTADWFNLAKLCRDNHFVILTRRKTHLTTYLISLGGLLKGGKLGYWTHAFMNLEDGINGLEDFKFIEAIGKGVIYSPFEKVFDCDSVVLLKPKGFTREDWTTALDRARTFYGKPYDTLFDLMNDEAVSCVELVRDAIRVAVNYEERFKEFEKKIMKAKGLTPDMFYYCGDFDVVVEIRR